MKRLFSLLLAVIIALLCLSGCAARPSSLTAGYDPRIIFLLDGGRSPELFMGSVADLMEEKLGGDISLSQLEPEEASAALADGSIDFYIGISDRFAPTGEISSREIFSIETLAVGVPSRGTQELGGANAVGAMGSSAFDAAKDEEGYHSIAQVLLVASHADALGAVANGEADFALMDEVNARALTAASEREYIIYDRPLYSADVQVFTPKAHVYRKSILSAAKYITKKGRLSDASVSLLGADITK